MDKIYCNNDLNIKRITWCYISPHRVVTTTNLHTKPEINIESLWLHLFSLNTNNEIMKNKIGFKDYNYKSLLGKTFSIKVKQ